MDIFPLDGTYEEEESNLALQRKAHAHLRTAQSPFIVAQNWKEWLWQIPRRLRGVVRPAAEEIKKVNEIAQTLPYETSEYVGQIVSSGAKVKKDVFPREWMQPAKMPFGEYEYTVPAEYDKILRQQYGDYMQFPPEADRQIPSIGAYWI